MALSAAGQTSGTRQVPAGARLSVAARGEVVVNGTGGNQVSWTLKGPSRARVVVRENASSVSLTVAGGSLVLSVPRTLRYVSVAAEGSVQVADLNGEANVATGGGSVKADRVRGGLTIRTAGGDIYLGEIGGWAHCSTCGGVIKVRRIGGEAVLETGGGDIVTDDIGGLLRAMTGGGAVRVGRAGGAVVASTGGGQIDIGEAAGSVELRNGGGAVRVGAAHGVRCEAGSGAIRLTNVYGSLRASTAIGSILAQLLAGQPAGDSFLTTGRGDITVVIPSNVGVRILAENEVSGGPRRIVSDFPGISVRATGARVVAEGEINGGGPLLRISGTGGTIFIKRQ